jgi:hypothetical protein
MGGGGRDAPRQLVVASKLENSQMGDRARSFQRVYELVE